MQHFRDLSEASIEKSSVAIGVFDGVHGGHQKLIGNMVSAAHAAQEKAVVITFYPHPAKVLGYRESLKYLTMPDEKVVILEDLGVDVVITQHFNQEFSMIGAREFMLMVKEHTGARHLWIGRDFALGHNREGNPETLAMIGKELGFELCIVESLQNSGEVVSSSNIRSLISGGEVLTARKLLRRSYAIEGTVIPGDQRGRLIGVPTANIAFDPEKLVPAKGVYACAADINNHRYPAAVNVGVRPTFDDGSEHTHIEAHLLGFSGDLYGQELRLEFFAYLRPERKFPDIEALISQIQQDIRQTHEIALGEGISS